MDSMVLLTCERPGDGQVYADRLLGHLVWADMEDVFTHVVVCGLALKGLVIAAHQRPVALPEGQEENSLLGGGGDGQRCQSSTQEHTLFHIYPLIYQRFRDLGILKSIA